MFQRLLSSVWVTILKESFLRTEWLSNLGNKKGFQSKQNKTASIATGNKEQNNNLKNHQLILPDKGSDAMHLIRSVWKQVNDVLLDDVTTMISYTGKTFRTRFNAKDKAVFNHEYDMVYYAKYPK